MVPAWLLSPVTGGYWGQILLGLALLVLTGLLAGAAIARLCGLRAGVISATLLAGWTSLQFLGGVNYHNQISGIWVGAAMLTLTFSRHGAKTLLRRGGITGLAGLFFGLAIHANPISLNLLPFLVLFAVSCVWPIRQLRAKAMGASIAGFVAGILVATGMLMVAAAAVGRDPLFFTQGADLASGLLGNAAAQKTWWVELSADWASLPRAGFAWHLVLPSMGIVAAGIVVLRWQRSWRIRAYPAESRIIATGALLTTVIFVGWNLVGQTSLSPDYFSYGLGFTSALAVALLVQNDQAHAPHTKPGKLVAQGAALGIAFAAPMLLYPVLPDNIMVATTRTWLLVLLVGLVAIATLAYPTRVLALTAAGLVLLGATNLLATARVNRTQYSWDPPAPGCRGSQAQGYQVIREANEWVDAVAPRFRATGAGPLWWPKHVEEMPLPCTDGLPVGNLLISWLNTGYNQLPGFVGGEPSTFVEVPAATLESLSRAETLIAVVTSSSPDAGDDLRAHGYQVRCTHTHILALASPRLRMCLGTVIRETQGSTGTPS